jgi:hypothetical protein
MDFTQIAMMGLGIACTALGWFARELYAATQSLRKDLSTLEIQIGRDYVRYDRLQDAMKPLVEAIKDLNDRVSNRLER